MSEETSHGQVAGEAPKIEFPCADYPIKVMGVSGVEFQEYVLATTEIHAPGFDTGKVVIKDSSKGTYQSMTLLITATGEQQLSDLNAALRASHLVKIVL